MMKFILHSTKNGCRLGSLLPETEQSVAHRCLETPMCMLYTRCGSVPHLMKDVLEKIEKLPALLQMPLTLLAEHHEGISGFQKGIKKFTANDDFLAYSCLQDPAVLVPSGYNDKHGASVWGTGGKVKLDLDLFLQVQEAMQPDWYQALSDSDTDHNSFRKRARKSVDRTLHFLDVIVEKHKKSERLQNTGIIGVVAGGYDLQERLRSATETASRPVTGFCWEGFHNFGPASESFKFSDISDIVMKTMAKLPEDKPRILPGILTPNNVLHAVQAGMDIMDTSYAYIATERGAALVFNYTIPTSSTSEFEQSSNGTEATNAFQDTLEIDLKDKKYFEDFGPLLEGCTCYTCKTHTRSYVHHLLNTSELLAGILLMIHNLHHYIGFFTVIRSSLQTDCFDKLCAVMKCQTLAR